ncbi:MAG: hypothetical protein AB8B73_00600 [Ekhidna sp.]
MKNQVIPDVALAKFRNLSDQFKISLQMQEALVYALGIKTMIDVGVSHILPRMSPVQIGWGSLFLSVKIESNPLKVNGV